MEDQQAIMNKAYHSHDPLIGPSIHPRTRTLSMRLPRSPHHRHRRRTGSPPIQLNSRYRLNHVDVREKCERQDKRCSDHPGSPFDPILRVGPSLVYSDGFEGVHWESPESEEDGAGNAEVLCRVAGVPVMNIEDVRKECQCKTGGDEIKRRSALCTKTDVNLTY